MIRTVRPLLAALSLLSLAACAPTRQTESEHAAANKSVSTPLQHDVSAQDDVAALKSALVACQSYGSALGRYRAPEAGQTDAMERLMTAWVAGDTSELPRHFEASPVGHNLTLLCESTNHGGGAYLVRSGKASELIVEAPHTLFDLGTLEVGLELFSRLGARAMLIDTVHRYKGARCEDLGLDEHDQGCVSDMAHSKNSLFQAAHTGLLAAAPGALVIQVHGFAPRAGDPDVILSNADTLACWSGIADGLNEKLAGYITFEYPEDIHELGGTRGMQAKHMRELGGRMMHIELSRRLRDAIGSDDRTASDFATVVGQGLLSETCG